MDWHTLDHSSHAVGQNCFHFTWAPKYRYPVFRIQEYIFEMEKILREVAQKHGMQVHELCIERDHVHCFASFPSTISVSKALGLLKGGSSYEFRKLHLRMRKYKALWSRGKFYRSVGSVTANAVQCYINDTHHVTRMPIGQRTLA